MRRGRDHADLFRLPRDEHDHAGNRAGAGARGLSPSKSPHRAVAGLDHRLDERRRPPQAQSVRHRAAAGRQLPPCAVRRAAGGVPAMRLRGYRSAVGIRFDLLQGAVALQKLPRTVRLFQMSLNMSSSIPRFHRLAVSDLRRESPDAVSLTFAVPQTLADDYCFAPGQYLTLRTTMDGAEVRRSYSICSGPDDGELRIAVKKVDGGAFSSWAADELKQGDELDVMTPTGRFGIAPAPGEARVYVGFAAGSGITPILSIVKGVLAREPDSRFFLFYGNRSTGDMLFREALEELKDRFMQRLSIFHVISGEEQDIQILHGRLDGEKVRVLLRSLVPATTVDHVFICGPTGMSEDIEATCRDIGIAAERIHVERFVSELGGKPRARKVIAASAPPKALASLIIDGKRREVPVAEGEAILDAALRAGMDLPFACKGGMCSTCRANLVEGTAQMEANYSLEPWELEKGFILTCQARPTSDRVVVDYDHV